MPEFISRSGVWSPKAQVPTEETPKKEAPKVKEAKPETPAKKPAPQPVAEAESDAAQ